MLCATLISACGELAPQASLEPTKPVQQPLIRTDFVDAAAASRQVGALGYTLGNSLSPMFMSCSAVLLGPTTVLTAAHCVTSWEKLQKSDSRVALHFTLSRDIGHSTKDNTARVVAAVPHPDYATLADGPYAADFAAGDDDIERSIRSACDMEDLVLPPPSAGQDEKSQYQAALAAEEAFHTCLSELFKKNDTNPKFIAQFLPPKGFGDIAVLFLDRPIRSAREKALVFTGTQDDLRARKDVLVVSYGSASTEAQQPTTAIGSVDGFKQMGRMQVSALSPTEALVTSESTALCFGDSGGGVFVQQGSDYVLVGIAVRAATTILTRRCINPGAFTRVAHYVPWINAVITERARLQDQPEPLSWWDILIGQAIPWWGP